MALWDSPEIETRDTSRRSMFMSVLGKINGAFSHYIMLFNGAIHLIKRAHFWNICVCSFTCEEAQQACANISLCMAAVSALQAVFTASWWMISLFSVPYTTRWCFQRIVSYAQNICIHTLPPVKQSPHCILIIKSFLSSMKQQRSCCFYRESEICWCKAQIF